MRKKLYLRQSTPKDLQKVLDFYDNNKHPFIAGRDRETMEDRVNAGAVTMLQDDNGDIQAISIAYPVTAKDDNGNEAHKWTEIGSTHVLMANMGLFDVMVGAQLLNAFLLEPPEDRFVIEIDPTNLHSKHVFKKLGCADYDNPPADMVKGVNGILAPEDANKGVDWLYANHEMMPALAKKFLDRIDNPVITNKATGEEYELDVSESPLGKHFVATLEKLAKKDYGQDNAPDNDKDKKQDNDPGTKKARNNLFRGPK
ncbi:MAG: hypothetical protein EP349_09735 [Alphaproteobacteria bacterium]|nr:MAG: hypothetical protein EP349_09735 [Alphaproteobacteria bacterium]